MQIEKKSKLKKNLFIVDIPMDNNQNTNKNIYSLCIGGGNKMNNMENWMNELLFYNKTNDLK